MRRIFFLLILAILLAVVASLMLPVLAFLFGLGIVTGLLVFLRRVFTRDRYQDLSHPVYQDRKDEWTPGE
jgi:hypothetical protein